MKKAILGSLTAVAVVVAGTLINAASATAAALSGEIQFDGEKTKATFTQNLIDFSLPEQIEVEDATESFLPFINTLGSINDIGPLPAGFDPAKLFLDLGVQGDGKDALYVSSIGDYGYTQSGANVAIDIPFWGYFLSLTDHKSGGAGNLTFQVNNKSVADVKALIQSGTGVTAAFSGAAFASVPEPASILGLGLVGGALVASRRRKASQMS
jgi:PEP-CTERM motif